MEVIKTYFLIPSSHRHLGLFTDLENICDANVNCIYIKKKESSGVRKLIQKFMLSEVVNSVMTLPGRERFYDLSELETELKKNTADKVLSEIVFLDGALRAFSDSDYERIRKTYAVKTELLLINSVHSGSASMRDGKDKIFSYAWDRIYSFDPMDCERYGFFDAGNAYYSMHSVLRSRIPADELTSDIYFCGGMKGKRSEHLHSIYQKLAAQDVRIHMCLFSGGRDRILHRLPWLRKEAGIHYLDGEWMDYEDVLRDTIHSNVILEVLQEGQTGPSLRYYEAVLAGKKLLTTNKGVSKLPFFDEDRMRVIENADEIDSDIIRWIKERSKEASFSEEAAAYFSPVRFLKDRTKF